MKKVVLLLPIFLISCIKDSTIPVIGPVIDKQQFNYEQSWILTDGTNMGDHNWNTITENDTLRFFYNSPDSSKTNGGDFLATSKGVFLNNLDSTFEALGNYFQNNIDSTISFKRKDASDSIVLRFSINSDTLVLSDFNADAKYDSLRFKKLAAN